MIDPYRMILVNLVASVLVLAGLFIYTRIYPKKKVNLFFLLIIISFLPLISMLRKGGYESGDLSYHVKYAMQFFENLQQGQLIPAWIEKSCSGYGCPSFIFTFLLSNYLISFFHVLGFSFIAGAKLLLAISFILSGVGMYMWMKDEFGEKPAFVAAIFYLFAPYHLIDLHFRVSIAEIVSMAILPFLFLTTKQFIETRFFRFFILTSVLFALLILSHQVTSLASFPLLLVYGCVIWIRNKKRNVKVLLLMVFSYICGLLLSAFYWLPFFVESRYIYYSLERAIFFHSFSDFFYPPNRFGFLFQGNRGQIYTSIGYTQWIVVLIGFCILLKRKIKGEEKIMLGGSIIIFLFLFLMMQSFTKPVWEIIPIIENFQFSWRLTIEAILVIAVIAAIVVKTYTNRWVFIILCFITIAYTILNWGNRKAIPGLNDSALRSHKFIFEENPRSIDVLAPIWVDKNKPWTLTPTNKRTEILSGSAEVNEISRLMTKHEYVVSAKTKVQLKENTYYFPGWRVLVDNMEAKLNYKNKQYPGIITFNVDKGLHKVEVIFTDTVDRMIGKWISMVTAIIMVAAIISSLKRFFPKRFI